MSEKEGKPSLVNPEAGELLERIRGSSPVGEIIAGIFGEETDPASIVLEDELVRAIARSNRNVSLSIELEGAQAKLLVRKNSIVGPIAIFLSTPGGRGVHFTTLGGLFLESSEDRVALDCASAIQKALSRREREKEVSPTGSQSALYKNFETRIDEGRIPDPLDPRI